MAQSRVFTIIGDSNVKRNISKTNSRACPLMAGAQILQCGHLQLLEESLRAIRKESDVCIVSCLTNFLTASEDDPMVSKRIEPVLDEFCSALFGASSALPGITFLIAPPMYRRLPVWYREGLPEIMRLFSQAFSPAERPQNLLLLTSFSTPEFDSDGVHLTAYSGLEYIMHLFDSAEEAIGAAAMPVEETTVKTSESIRVLEDRVMVLEQDHRRLSRVVENKIAVDAELADFHANERTEDFFVIAGLSRIPDELTGKDWQDQAVKDVKAALLILMGKNVPIVFVKNATYRHEGAEVTYNVQVPSVAESKAIRTKFGSFFLGGKKVKPAGLESVSIKNFVTPNTRIRISLLKLIAQKYRDANPRSMVKVIGFDPRPLIKITPSPSANDRRVQIYNFVEAVKVLPCSFAPSEVEPIVRRINSKLLGQVRSIFIILSDDQFRKHLSRFNRGQRSQAAPGAAEATPEATEVISEATSEAISDNDPEQNVAQIPSAVPAAVASGSKSSGSKSRSNLKRGANSPAESAPAKK